MSRELYSISVYEDCVRIDGVIGITEAFDFINFFDQKGYNKIIPGEENSTILFMKDSEIEKQKEENKIIDHLHHEIGTLKNSLIHLNRELQKAVNDSSDRFIKLRDEYEKAKKQLTVYQIQNSDLFKNMNKTSIPNSEIDPIFNNENIVKEFNDYIPEIPDLLI